MTSPYVANRKANSKIDQSTRLYGQEKKRQAGVKRRERSSSPETAVVRRQEVEEGKSDQRTCRLQNNSARTKRLGIGNQEEETGGGKRKGRDSSPETAVVSRQEVEKAESHLKGSQVTEQLSAHEAAWSW